MCVTWPIHMRDMLHSHLGHGSFVCVTWLLCVYDMTPLCVWHDSCVCVAWILCVWDMTPCVCLMIHRMWNILSSHCNTLQHTATHCNMPLFLHSIEAQHIVFTRVTWLLLCVCNLTSRTRDMTHAYVWSDLFICVARCVHMCDMTPVCVWHDSSCVWREAWLVDKCMNACMNT